MDNNENGFDSMFEDALKALDKLVESARPKTKEQIEAIREQEEVRRRAQRNAKEEKMKEQFADMARMCAIAHEAFMNEGFTTEQSFTLLFQLLNKASVGGK